LAAFAVAISLILILSGGPADAQWTQDLPTPFAQNAVRPENVSEARVKDRYLWPECPRGRYEFDVSYPRGMDSGGPVDLAVTAVARGYIGKARTDSNVWYRDIISVCDPDLSEYFMTSTLEISSSPYKVSQAAYSVLFSWRSESGGAHGNYGYNSANFLADGTPVTLGRLFPDAQRSLPLLWNHIFSGFCESFETAPSFYGSPLCSASVPPLPGPLSNPATDLNEAGHMLLTSYGLSVILGPYEGYSFADGSKYGDITKEDLLGMGADPDIWR
jgi:hypothetical protein